MYIFFTIFGGGFLYIAFKLSKDYKKYTYGLKNNLIALTSKINSQLQLIFLLSYILFLFLFLLGDFTEKPLIKYKINYACSVYVFFMFLTGISIFINFIRPISIISTALGFIKLIRIGTSTIIGLIIFLPSLLNGYNLWHSIKIALPFYLAALGGFALNDYFDAAKDRIDKPYRAIPSGKISLNQALFIGCFFSVIATFVTCIISNSTKEFLIYISAIIGIVIYNFIVKKFAIIKTLVAAILCGLPILFIYVSLNIPFQIYLY